jgi:hypothetical protein
MRVSADAMLTKRIGRRRRGRETNGRKRWCDVSSFFFFSQTPTAKGNAGVVEIVRFGCGDGVMRNGEERDGALTLRIDRRFDRPRPPRSTPDADADADAREQKLSRSPSPAPQFITVQTALATSHCSYSSVAPHTPTLIASQTRDLENRRRRR